MAGVATFGFNPRYIVNGDMSNATPPAGGRTATIVGGWIDTRRKKTIAAQATWSGTATGTWGLQITFDEDPIRAGAANARFGATLVAPSASMTAANPAGAAPTDGVYFESPVNGAPYARWVYIRSANGSANGLQL